MTHNRKPDVLPVETPRQALSRVNAFCSANVSANTPGMGAALNALEKLVSEDEARSQRPDVLPTEREATTAGTEPGSPPTELEALEIIVAGFDVLPAEARGRTYAYLMSRYPQSGTRR